MGGEGLFTGNFERYLKEGSGNGASVSVAAVLGEPGGGGSCTGDPEEYVEEGSGGKHLSP